MVSPQHKALVVPADARVENTMPHARALPTGQLLVPHKPAEVRILRNLGYAVPSPILHTYDWRGTTPFHAQKVTAGMLVVEPRAFVLSTMGTGKTRSVLFAYDWLRQNKLVKKMLVVAPLSTLNFTWAKEVMQVVPNYRVGVVYGSKERREKILRDPRFDIYVINHEGVGVVEDLIAKLPDLDVLCLDEVAVYRHHTTKKWKVMNKLTGRFKHVWGLTGTPTPREPTDAYGIIKLVRPEAYTGSLRTFQDKLMIKVSNFKWVARKGSEAKVYEIMQPAVRFTMADCVDMPPVTYTDHAVKLVPKQQHVYDVLRKHCRMLTENGSITAVNGGVLLNKLLQVSSGCVYDDKGGTVVLDAAPRLDECLSLIQQNDRKAIVFCPYIPLVHMVAEHLAAAGVHVRKVYGETPRAERDEIFTHFQDAPVTPGVPEVIVAHPKTMAHGLTLTAANLVLWYAPTSDLEIYEQANARIARPGQSASKIQVRHLVGSRVEELTYKSLQNRQKVQDVLLKLYED